VKRLAANLPALLIALLCGACMATPGDGLYDNHPASDPPTSQRPPSSATPPPQTPATSQRPPSAVPSHTPLPEQETLRFGRSYTWDDGVTLTVGKPQRFTPSEFAVIKKSRRYVKFTVTVVNKSKKPIDLGLTYISVQSDNKEADHVFDFPTGLQGPPDAKVPKGSESQFHVGFGVADPKDMIMEVALHDQPKRSSLLYST
jgi:hypothetical protein